MAYSEKTTEYSKIYDHFYLQFTKKTSYKPSNNTKVRIINEVFNDIPWNEQQAMRACIRYNVFTVGYHVAEKVTGIRKKSLIKLYEQGKRHMLSPNKIATAVPSYYYPNFNKRNKPEEYWDKLTQGDLGDNKYVLGRLNKSGIYYRQQLFRHLEAGWYYLWTIPGIGDGSKQIILQFIDKINKINQF